MTLQGFDLAGRVAIVTGGNGGIGLGMAKGLSAAGAHVVIAARREDKARAALATLGPAAEFVFCDVSDPRSCQALAEAVADQHGRIDALIANAGIGRRDRPEDVTLTSWHETMDVNVRGVLLCAQAVHPVMRQAQSGKIVTIGSMLSIFGAATACAYAASKGAVVQLTRSLASAWAADGIQVNAVLPGWIDTDLVAGTRATPEIADRITVRTPARRWGTPEDLAGIAVFLCSTAADFVTGTAIPVDGGFSIEL